MKRFLSLLPRWLVAEFSVFVALAIAAAGLFIFAELAESVADGDTHTVDEAILRAFRTPGDAADPLGPVWLEVAMRDITALGSTTVLTLITAAVFGYLLIERKGGAALFVVIAVASGGALSYLLKLGFDRPRPDLVAHLVDVHTLSFPSGHAMGAAVTFLTLGALIVRTERDLRLKAYVLTVAVMLTLLIGVSRIYLGVHWPSDVLAGWCAGSAWALMCWLAALWLQRRGQIEGETPASPAESPDDGLR